MKLKSLFQILAACAFAGSALAQPATTGTLKTAVPVPIVMNGKQVGSTTLPAGAKVTLVQESAGKTLIKAAVGETWVANEALEVAAPEPVAAAPTPAPEAPATGGTVAPATQATAEPAANSITPPRKQPCLRVLVFIGDKKIEDETRPRSQGILEPFLMGLQVIAQNGPKLECPIRVDFVESFLQGSRQEIPPSTIPDENTSVIVLSAYPDKIGFDFLKRNWRSVAFESGTAISWKRGGYKNPIANVEGIPSTTLDSSGFSRSGNIAVFDATAGLKSRSASKTYEEGLQKEKLRGEMGKMVTSLWAFLTE